MVRTLRDCRARELRWLGLSGCRIGDSGLAALLPLLTGRDSTLVSLEALTLASNQLADVRLLSTLLRGRARMCFERRATPLQLLDLSGNPRLGDSVLSGSSARASSARRKGSGKGVPRPGAVERPKGRRGALVRAATCAIAEGLPLRVLRLRRMGLDGDSLQPFLHLMQTETQRCLASDGALSMASGFCVEELDLAGNDLEPALIAAVDEGLQLLRAIREGTGIFAGQLPVESGIEEEADAVPQQLQQQSAPRCPWRRARSEPPGQRHESAPRRSQEALTRDAMSDGEENVSKSKRGKAASREALLLQRAEDRRRFHKDAAELSRRQSRGQQNDAPCADGLRSWADAPLAIAGVLGPTEAQSLVRQAILAELRGDAADRNATAISAAAPYACEGGAEVTSSTFTRAEKRQGANATSCREDQQCRGTGSATFGRFRERYGAAARHEEVQFPQRSDRTCKSPGLSGSSSDAEEESSALSDTQVLRDCRLDQLRAAVLGALTDSVDAESLHAGADFGGGDAPIVFAHGDYEDSMLADLRRDVLRDARPTVDNYMLAGPKDPQLDSVRREVLREHNYMPTMTKDPQLDGTRREVLREHNYMPTMSKDGLLGAKLDDMHREALGDLCQARGISQSGLPSRTWGV